MKDYSPRADRLEEISSRAGPINPEFIHPVYEIAPEGRYGGAGQGVHPKVQDLVVTPAVLEEMKQKHLAEMRSRTSTPRSGWDTRVHRVAHHRNY